MYDMYCKKCILTVPPTLICLDTESIELLDWLASHTLPFGLRREEGSGYAAIIEFSPKNAIIEQRLNNKMLTSVSTLWHNCIPWQYMWQSQIEIEYYSVAYFECITELVTLLCLVFAEGRAHMRFIDTSDIHAISHCVWALPLTEAHAAQ